MSAGDGYSESAWVSRETGAIFTGSETAGISDELPDDIDDPEKYLPIPSRRDLDLGRPLVMQFAADRLEERYDEIADIFRRKGGYRRFKDFLHRIGALDAWYAYENEATEKALREWCAENGVEVEG